jgi:hypothetical protein
LIVLPLSRVLGIALHLAKAISTVWLHLNSLHVHFRGESMTAGKRDTHTECNQLGTGSPLRCFDLRCFFNLPASAPSPIGLFPVSAPSPVGFSFLFLDLRSPVSAPSPSAVAFSFFCFGGSLTCMPARLVTAGLTNHNMAQKTPYSK